MKEVEVKVKVKDPAHVEEALHKLGCVLGEPIVQRDWVFIDAKIDFSEIKPGARIARIRKSNGHIILTAKQRRENTLESTEYEVIVDDAERAKNVLNLLGYREVIRVNKSRRSGRLGDVEICLDDVDGLGVFVEAEKMASESEDGPKIQKELFDLLIKLGVSAEDREYFGYDIFFLN